MTRCLTLEVRPAAKHLKPTLGQKRSSQHCGYFNGCLDCSGTSREAGQPSTKDGDRPPSFDREGNLTLLLQQFGNVATANGWMSIQRTLHFRSQLSNEAQSCGHNNTYNGIIKDREARN